MAQVVKNLLAMQGETWVRSLDHEDPLEKRMATHSSILAQRIPWTEEPGRLHQKELDMTEQLTLFTSFSFINNLKTHKILINKFNK